MRHKEKSAMEENEGIAGGKNETYSLAVAVGRVAVLLAIVVSDSNERSESVS